VDKGEKINRAVLLVPRCHQAHFFGKKIENHRITEITEIKCNEQTFIPDV